jgi:hypothetical protein
MMRSVFRLAAGVLPLLLATRLAAQADSTWRQHDAAADSAMAHGDWADARRHSLALDRLLGGHPAVPAQLARIALRAGDTAEALAQLGRLEAMGVASRVFGDTAFASLRLLPAFQRLAAAVTAAGATVGSARLVAEMPDAESLVEDLAWDAARRRVIVSDVHRHRLRAVSAAGRVTDFGPPLPAGWGVLGLGVDRARGTLWASAFTLPQAEGYAAVDSGRAEVLRLDLATGRVRRRFGLPRGAAPGDLAVAENGDVFVGDGRLGTVYVVRRHADSVEVLVPPGRIRSTQQPAIALDGRTLFVPDYGRGLARVDRASGAVRWVGRPAEVTLTGMDGLLMDGCTLIAVQNGVNPNRIVRLTLDAALDSVVRADILLRDTTLAPEPTHAAFVDGALWVIGRAGWARFDDDGRAAAGVPRRPPSIVRIARGVPAARRPCRGAGAGASRRASVRE